MGGHRRPIALIPAPTLAPKATGTLVLSQHLEREKVEGLDLFMLREVRRGAGRG